MFYIKNCEGYYLHIRDEEVWWTARVDVATTCPTIQDAIRDACKHIHLPLSEDTTYIMECSSGKVIC